MMDGFMNLLISYLQCFMLSFNELYLLMVMTHIGMVLQQKSFLLTPRKYYCINFHALVP